MCLRTDARPRVRDARPTDDLESRVYARLDGMLMDPDTDTIRSAAADPAPVLLNLPPAAAGVPVPAVRGGIVSRRALFERLSRAGRITQVSAPAGSGKTFLLRSWIGAAGQEQSTAWGAGAREE